MAEIRTMTRTNYFRVNDREKFKELVARLKTDVQFMENKDGTVGFYGDAVYGLPVDPLSDNVLEKFKKALKNDSLDAVAEFIGHEINGSMGMEDIMEEIDDTIAQMPEEELTGFVEQYVDVSTDYEGMWNAFVKELQGLLEPGCACIITSIEWENLRVVNGMASIITHDNDRAIDLNTLALAHARDMLGDPGYSPKMTY